MTLKAFWIIILPNLSMLNPTESNKTELQLKCFESWKGHKSAICPAE